MFLYICECKALTHWGRVAHMCISKLTIIGSDNGLSPDRRQAIIWTNAEILLIGPLGTNFSEILIESHAFSFKKMHLKMSSGKWRPFCLGLNVLTHWCLTMHQYASTNWATIDSGNELSPAQSQAITWTCAYPFIIGCLWTIYGEISIKNKHFH